MPLKYKYTDATQIPAEFKSLYVQRDNVWILDADGAADATQLQEFRDNNIALLKLTGETDITKAKEKLARLKDVDPVKYKELLDAAAEAEAKKLKDAGKIEELHRQQIEAKDAAHLKVVQAKDAENGALKKRLEILMVDDAIASACAKKGVSPEAMQDAKLRGKLIFQLDGDKVVAKEGDKLLFDDKAQPQTIEYWLDQRLAGDCKHWAMPNRGGGAGGSTQQQKSGAANPWSTKTFNRTLQAKMSRENPELAKSMQASAEK